MQSNGATFPRQDELLKELNSSLPPRKLIAFIDTLDVSADFKTILRDLSQVIWKVGTAVIAVGRKILSVALEVVSTYPGTVFSVVIAGILTAIVGAIPLVGPLLAAFLGPIMLATGLTMGAVSDLRSSAWAGNVAALQAQLASVRV